MPRIIERACGTRSPSRSSASSPAASTSSTRPSAVSTWTLTSTAMPSRYGFGSPWPISSAIERSASTSAISARPAVSRTSARVQRITPSANRLFGAERLGDPLGAGELRLGLGGVALLHPQVAEIVARHRLLPRLAGLDRHRQQHLQALRPGRRRPGCRTRRSPCGARTRGGPGRLVRSASSTASSASGQRGGVRAGEEVQVALERGQLRARVGVVAGVQVALCGQRAREGMRPLPLLRRHVDGT